MTDPARRRRIEEMCDAALDRDAGERAAFVAAACADDHALRRDVEALLAHAQTAEGFLAAPMGAVAAHLLGDARATSLVGQQIGSYTILSHLGAGGMGEVYRARDTKLHREVALKVIPDTFALDPDRLARFKREAQVLAALNHPHIGAIYGFEDGGETHALVLELVDGDTLADRIAHGPITVKDALLIARQIAEALETAHEQGIIHRDLKPANIKVTPDGVVKVLDFGLAKLLPARDAGGGPTQAPTITIGGTREGLIVGTAAYMSPEQARGLPVDKRTDIWAFGCVLYEMLTGSVAFPGQTMSDTIAAILEREPDWQALTAAVPPTIRRLLMRCLHKDRKQRLHDIADARIEIDEALTTPASIESVIPVPEPRRRWRVTVAATVLALGVGALVAGAAVWLAIRPSPPRVTRLVITPPGTAAPVVTSNTYRDVAISPDGTRLVYGGGDASRLFVRALDRTEPIPLEGLGVPYHPFFSPDGEWIGYFDGLSGLKKVSINGGPAVSICRVSGLPGGATWGSDGTIIFATASGLLRVAATGGEPEVLTMPSAPGESYGLPSLLPGGHAVLFTIGLAAGGYEIAAFDFGNRTRKILVRDGSSPRYVPTGHLVYAASGGLRAVPFDLDRLEVAGTPVPLVEPVLIKAAEAGPALDFDVSENGTMVYVPGNAQMGGRTLVWVDRHGQEEPIKAPVRGYTSPRLSPDGTRVALDVRDQEFDIWIWNFAREALTRLTLNPASDQYPVWTPEGQRLLFDSSRAGAAGSRTVFWQTADGAGTAEQLTRGPNPQFPYTISPDGTRVVFREDSPKTGQDLMLLTLDKERHVQPLVQTTFNELNAEISPDGRWFAYESNESGQYEVYVQPFPDATGGRWQISTGGGTKPLWARNGQELFYVGPTGALMAASIERGNTFAVSAQAKLFEGRYYMGSASGAGRTYDISPDGRRFLMMKADTSTSTSIVVVQNWFEELKRLVPAK